MGQLRPARFYHALADGRLACDLCPHHCRLQDGQRGRCFQRMRQGDRIVLPTWGLTSGLAVDPIEKKPLYHFLPDSRVLSFGTIGCNLSCKFCQNWRISTARDTELLRYELSPEAIAKAAQESGSASVAFTYNEPTVFAEYAMATADACHAAGVRTVAVTAGYICQEARAEFYQRIDAANVDLKAFREAFYQKLSGAHLAPVLETLVYLAKHTSVWLELTTLLIPGLNDSDREISELSAWVHDALGPHVPLHFSAFHPDHRLRGVHRTELATLRRARAIALRAGLLYVYTGNVADAEGSATYCPGCRAPVVTREGFDVTAERLTRKGDGSAACGACGAPVHGVF